MTIFKKKCNSNTQGLKYFKVLISELNSELKFI